MRQIQRHFPFADPVSVCDYVAATGSDEGYKTLGKPKEATDADPGSPEKIRILRKRLEEGRELWHEKDLTDSTVLQRLLETMEQLAERPGSGCAD